MNVEQRIGLLLKEHGWSLSAAESCTGGRISHLITTVSGSSSYYLGSVTSYAVSVKEKVLGVSPSVIENKGVVSSEVAAAMAEGVRRLTGSTFAVATTGLAEGSDGHYPEGTFTEIFQCEGPRKSNIKRFTTAALRFLEKNIVDYINNCK